SVGCITRVRPRFFFSSRRRHTRFSRDWSSDVCSSDLAGAHAELAEDGGHVGLDGGLGDVELVGDLLVQQPLADHGQYPELLRGETGQAGAGLARLVGDGRRLLAEIRPPGVAVQHGAYRLLDRKS